MNIQFDRLCAVLAGVRSFVVKSSGWRRPGLAFAAGAVSVLAMAPFFLWPVLFFTLPVFVWLLDSCGSEQSEDPRVTDNTSETLRSQLRAAAFDGWWFGFGYFFFSLYWIGEAFLVEADIFGWLMPFAIVVMPAGLALYWGLIAALSRAVWPEGLSRILVLAVAFGIGEWVRGHLFTGLPWNVLGYAFTYPLALMQSASLLGIYGLTLWVVVVCASPMVVLVDAGGNSKRRRQALFACLAVTVVPLVGMYAFGSAQLANATVGFVDGVKLRLVQPSVPQRDKWLGEKQSGIFADHLALSRKSENGRVDDLAGITHVIWPEASMPFLPLKYPQAIKRIGDLLPDNSYLIAGALRVENSENQSSEIPYDDPDGSDANSKDTTTRGSTQQTVQPRIFNSLMVFGRGGDLAGLYDKTHLVPFGEYLPFRDLLESIGLRSLTRLRGGFENGLRPRPLVDIPGLGPVGVLICYEAIFGGGIIQGSKRPKLLINVTNDGWFGNTTGPRQHFHKSRVRAVEEGVPLIRSANNGISAVIDPYGRVLKSLALNVKGSIDSGLPRARAPTVYAIWADAIFVLNALVFLSIALILRANGSPTRNGRP